MTQSPRSGYLASTSGDGGGDRSSRRLQRLLLGTGLVFFVVGLVTLLGVPTTPPSLLGPPGSPDSPDAGPTTATPTATPTPAPNQETAEPTRQGENRTGTPTDGPVVGVGL